MVAAIKEGYIEGGVGGVVVGSNEAESAVLVFTFLDHEAHPFSCFLAVERALSVQGPLPLLSEPYPDSVLSSIPSPSGMEKQVGGT